LMLQRLFLLREEFDWLTEKSHWIKPWCYATRKHIFQAAVY